MKVQLAALALVAAFCAGCSTTLERDTPKTIAVADGAKADMTAIAEALLDLKGTKLQGVVGNWKENVFSAEFVMKGDGETMTIAVIAPAMRLATITLSRPHALRYERIRKIPAAFDPEYVLFDLAIVNLETDVLARALGPGFTVYDDGTNRVVSLPSKDSKPGDPVSMLVRNKDGTMQFYNLKLTYEYTVTPLQ